MPTTVNRVPLNSRASINRQISEETEERVQWYANHPHAIGTRLKELDAEWDIERTLEANASALAFAGIALGTAVDKRFYVLPAVVTAFLFQHAIQGWCPPLPLLRRLGFRTAREIDVERYALKALRGDFRRGKRTNGSARYVLEAARA
jgi:hypothetical protein